MKSIDRFACPTSDVVACHLIGYANKLLLEPTAPDGGSRQKDFNASTSFAQLHH